ncbi:uncharacterized protein LOC123517658 [Portunus trituberculatus]|uniref:uncharacterized protein LOC123517658 n=1 Tax=Portunus trituberculatus TaxID=210409 RepID=UPI001E1CFAF8|nr:uncharacterized protein LOC123517658 [Portunus trituberculatus]
MREAYNAYFGMPVGDQDKPWAPHFTCELCKRTLEGWYRGENRAMRFAIPRIWREPTDHSSNCFFCMVDPSKRRAGKMRLLSYILTFCHPLRQCHTALSSPYPL